MTTQSWTTRVLIIGGGPSGLAAALELSRHGVDCVLVEPRRTVSADRPRAKTTSARTMELFRRWGVADAVRDAAPLPPAWSDRVVFCESLSGALVTEFDDCFGLTDPDGVMAELGQQIPQPLVEQVLRRRVRDSPYVQLWLGARVTELSGQAGSVLARISTDAGDVVVEADYALGCDGANGIARRSCGIELVGDSDPRPNFNVVFRAPGLDTALGPAVQYWSVGGPTAGVLGRLDLDGTWWAIAPGVDAEAGAAAPSALLERLVGRDFPHEILSTDPWTARMLVAERFRSGRVFLVGEAAHLNPPWGGHGYNTCVGDAVNLCWKIAAVLQGWADEELLDSYESERRPIAERTIAIATANMATLSTDIAARSSRSAPAEAGESVAAFIQRTKRAEFHGLGLVLGYSYAGSAVVQPGRAPSADPTTYRPSTEPGSRLPHTWTSDGTALFDALGPALTLVGPLQTAPGAVDALLRRSAGLGIPLAVVESPAHYPYRHEFLLVRPDQHIAWRSTTPDDIDLDQAVGRQQLTLVSSQGEHA